MRAITKQAVSAFLEGYDFHLSNTRVEKGNMYLFGNLIAKRNSEGIFISDCGYQTVTTKERLNGILDTLFLERIYAKKFVWYRNDTLFKTREWVKIK